MSTFLKILLTLLTKETKLEIQCRKEREKNTNLRTQIRLGVKDLELLTKNKGDRYWKIQDVEFFGELLEIETDISHLSCSPTTPEGRNVSVTDDSVQSKRNRSDISGESPEGKIQKIHDISHDNPQIPLSNSFEVLKEVSC